MMTGFGSMMLFGGLLFILFWVVVIGAAVWFIVTLTRGSQGQAAADAPTHAPVGNQTPLDIAKTRYARGEITKEQFEEIKRALEA